MNWLKSFKFFKEELVVDLKCPICGSRMYQTHSGGQKATYQCGSNSAKFWNFDRGTKEEREAHEHFVKSTTYVDRKDVTL